jgi:amidohydrolase
MDAHSEICRAIDAYKDTVVALSRRIHRHPELKFEERFAAGLLAGAIADLGVETETGLGGLKTAFRSSIGSRGPVVAILAEYDALPNGHSCGHNLISGAALAAFAGLVHMRTNLPGRVILLGTPAEEGGGGKIILLEKGSFKGVDAAMMAHPTDVEYSTIPALATRHLRITFHGKAAHAAAAPWEGSSALAAVIQTFQAADAARLHLRDMSRLHGIITNGGQAVNIIPELTVCEFLARAKTNNYAGEIADRVLRCAEGAAVATGTKVSHEVIGAYKNMINNLTMARRYAHHCEALGVHVPEPAVDFPTGSTDMGDVSYVMPAIHPLFKVAEPGDGNCHEDAFVSHADSPRGYEAMIRVAKAMAMTAYDLLSEPELLRAAKAEFAGRDRN